MTSPPSYTEHAAEQPDTQSEQHACHGTDHPVLRQQPSDVAREQSLDDERAANQNQTRLIWRSRASET